DELGSQREKYEDPLPNDYYQAFKSIESQIGNQIFVATENQVVIGCLQLTIIPGLARQGMKRAQIEGERVDGKQRGKGTGVALLKEAIANVKSDACMHVQLTTDKQRNEAQRFYEQLGYAASNE